ncbi:hypothetical protein D9611_011677 [Ephemerocybe angulata]|uniref:Uncharacterized protein n=1 Tax=Ephemerocybe angulata TaxID=980116 RepID=A0A8H5C527_9AGAR|nr:hypothetical protein D9611_011677 [Tulosesus angulatus]
MCDGMDLSGCDCNCFCDCADCSCCEGFWSFFAGCCYWWPGAAGPVRGGAIETPGGYGGLAAEAGKDLESLALIDQQPSTSSPMGPSK